MPKISTQVGDGVEKSVREMRIEKLLYIYPRSDRRLGEGTVATHYLMLQNAVLVATLRKRYGVKKH